MKARRVRRSPWVTAASCIPWALIPVAIVASLITRQPFAAITPHLALIGAALFWSTWREKPRARLEPVTVDADETALRIGDAKIPRARVKDAQLRQSFAGPTVRVSLSKQTDEELVVEDDDAAHALLKKLGLDPSQTTASYRMASLVTTRYRWAPLLFLPIAFFGGLLSAAFHAQSPIFIPALVLVMLPFLLTPSTLVVGVDGLLVKWLWMREFIATKEIRSAQRFDTGSGRNRRRGVELDLADRNVQLPMYSDEAIATILQRVRDVRALARSSEHVEVGALLLARGDRDLRGWITQLKALGAGETATLRTAAVNPENLWRVAEDPAQPAMMRAAAAVALSPALGESDKVRLAEVAKTTAAPKLRVALERAATEASDEEMEEALRELEG
jgi:hypothetical protein